LTGGDVASLTFGAVFFVTGVLVMAGTSLGSWPL